MNPGSVRVGLIGATVLALFYALIVGGSGGIAHLGEQAAADWPWLMLILVGFGTQVGLFVELRHRQRLHAGMRAAAGTGAGAGAGASTVGMVACCAHHLADLVPIIGLSGAAVFLTDYGVPILIAGVLLNAVGVFLAARRLRHTPLPSSTTGALTGEVSS